jgi:CBS domain-containing protein
MDGAEVNMLVADVLRGKGHEVVTVGTDTKISDIVEILAARRIGAVVVLDRFKAAGIFSERDLVNVLASHGSSALGLHVAGLMTSPIVSGHPEDRIEHSLDVMTRERIRHLPVLQDGNLVGLVSIGDLVKHRLSEKELEADVMRDLARMRT